MTVDADALRARMEEVARAVEHDLDHLLPPAHGSADRLYGAMRYATLGGGKRIRPFLTVAAGEMFDADQTVTRRVGAAIEMVHSYSLVHDDLPAMDDALLRRGQPSCHRQFDDATAILAGDALQALAFEVLVGAAIDVPPEVRVELARGLAYAAGGSGMCGGQMIDLLAEHRQLSLAEVLELQRLKTGALISFACEAGAIVGRAPDDARASIRAFAGALGLAFQIRDDLLDVEGDVALTGKDQGIDAASGKATVVGLLGVDGAKMRLAELHDQANGALQPFGPKSGWLRAVMEFVIQRSS